MRILFLLAMPILGFCQPVSKTIQNYIERNPPPNGKLLYDNLYMDMTEVANIHWVEYLYHLKRDSSEEVANKAYPHIHALKWPQIAKDSLMARSLYQGNRYLHDPKFRYYPVIGITKEQAEHYCRWRSQVVNHFANEKLVQQAKAFRVRYIFRLPTEKEWEFAAFGKLDSSTYPYGLRFLMLPKKKGDRKKLKKGQSFPESEMEIDFNCSTATSAFAWNKGNTMEYIYKHVPNELGLYNMIGNAAEMVVEEETAKGGSWIHPKEECQVKRRHYFACPSEWVGFRCVGELEIIENLKDTVVAAMPPVDWYKSNCNFVQGRKRLDAFSRFERIKAAYRVGENKAFGLKINETVIDPEDTIRKKFDFSTPKYAKEGLSIRIELPQVRYDSISIHLVKVEGPDMKYDEQQVSSRDKIKLEVGSYTYMYDALVITLYFKTLPFGQYKTMTIARRM